MRYEHKHNGNIHSMKALLTYFKSLGYGFGSNSNVEQHANVLMGYSHIVIIPVNLVLLGGNSSSRGHTPLTLDEIYNGKFYVPETLVLTSAYTATILVNGDVQVGCTTFPATVIVELAKKVHKQLDKR